MQNWKMRHKTAGTGGKCTNGKCGTNLKPAGVEMQEVEMQETGNAVCQRIFVSRLLGLGLTDDRRRQYQSWP